MDFRVKTKPTVSSITVDMVKANKRIRHASEDSLIEQEIAAADAWIEKRTNLALMRQTLVLRLRRILPSVYLPRPPLDLITAISFTPTGGSAVIVDPGTGITQRGDAMLPVIDIKQIAAEADGTMEIEYMAGFQNADAVPAPLRLAAVLLVSHWLTSREAAFMDARIMNVVKEIPFGVDALLKEYRVPNVNEDLNGGW